MSFFSNIGNAIKQGTKDVGGLIGGALDLEKSLFTNPITFVTKGPDAAIAASNKLSQPQSVARIVGTTVAAGTAATIALTPGALATVGSALVPKSTVGKIAGGAIGFVAAPVIAGQIVKQPEKIENVVYNTPGNVVDTQRDLYNFSKDPLTVDSGIAFVKSHPYLTAATAGAALAALGYTSITISSILSNYFNTKAVNNNTKLMENPPVIPPVVSTPPISPPPSFSAFPSVTDVQPAPPSSTAVVAPSTTKAMGAPAHKKKKKKSKKKAKKRSKTHKKTRRSKKKKKSIKRSGHK